MAKVETILVLKREDLLSFYTDTPFEELQITYFRGGFKQFYEQPFVMFIDNDLRTKLFKNKFGVRGEIKKDENDSSWDIFGK